MSMPCSCAMRAHDGRRQRAQPIRLRRSTAGPDGGVAASAGAEDRATTAARGGAGCAARAGSGSSTTAWPPAASTAAVPGADDGRPRVLTGTVSPSCTRISSSVPASGDGISASTLSVEISNSGSSLSTASPIRLIQRTMVPSATDSPIWGITTSAIQRQLATLGARRTRAGQPRHLCTCSAHRIDAPRRPTGVSPPVRGVGRFADRLGHRRVRVDGPDRVPRRSTRAAAPPRLRRRVRSRAAPMMCTPSTWSYWRLADDLHEAFRLAGDSRPAERAERKRARAHVVAPRAASASVRPTLPISGSQ